MKKILLLIILSICAILPIKAKADVGAPAFSPYEAIVAKEEGAIFYDYDYENNKLTTKETIPKGTKLEINMDVTLNGTTYGNTYYGDNPGYVKLEDLMPADATYDLNKAKRITDEQKGYVYSDDVYLYKGPSKLYEKVRKEPVPKGTIVTYEYADENYDLEGGIVWAYITVDKDSGWVYTFQDDSVLYEEVSGIASIAIEGENKVTTIKDIKALYSSPNDEEPSIKVNIPAWTELEYEYYISEYYQDIEYVYVNYNGVGGWLKAAYTYGKLREEGTKVDALYKDEGSFYVIKEAGLNLYKELLDESSKIDKTIPSKEEVKYTFSYEDVEYKWYYVTYEGSNYWTKSDYNEYEGSKEIADKPYEPTGYYVLESIPLYSMPNKESKILTKVPLSSELEVKYSYSTEIIENGEIKDVINWAYVTLNGISGWIIPESLPGKYEYTLKALQELKIYSEPSIDDNKVVTTITKDEDLQSKYSYNENKNYWYYVNYNGKVGWIPTDYLVRKEENNYKTNNNITDYIYDSPFKTSPKSEMTIPKDTKIKSTYYYYGEKEAWLYISNNGVSGWIIYDQEQMTHLYETKKLVEIKKPTESPLPTIESKPSKETKLEPNIIIALSVLGALCLSITALVIILLSNKKKQH